MLVIPFQISASEYNVFILLGPENLERIQAHDPAQMDITRMEPNWRRLRLHTVLIGYGTKKEEAEVIRYVQAGGKVMDALQHLSRGFQFRPDKGDSDEPYTSVKSPKKT